MALSATLLTACGQAGQGGDKPQVEKLPTIQPHLPEVPTLPPAPYPVRYDDQSFSVYGLRKELRKVIDQDVTLTGYIVNIYAPEPCPKGETCPPPRAPHLWLADSPEEKDPEKLIRLCGYAENHEELAKAARSSKAKPEPESGMVATPTDFAEGAKIKVKGRFAYVSGLGFNDASGLLDYKGHETLEGGSQPNHKAPSAKKIDF
ncbi:MAG: hypothetical protein H6715_04335 [Myxococcales bacterium]|nr:hypothetical protein [Myxococcales bacterium]MCB9709489.1 hypothetical protein [Myxococcales bacterium]